MQTQGCDLLNTLLAFAPSLVALAGIGLAGYINWGMLKQKKIEDERREIYKKLNSFYGPFQQLRGRTRVLYECFALTEKENSPEFATLTALLKGQQFDQNDIALLEEIIRLTQQSDQFIIENAGLIDDPDLRDLFAKVGAHWRILRLAYNKSLVTDTEIFRRYSFPWELDQKVEEKINELQQALSLLNR